MDSFKKRLNNSLYPENLRRQLKESLDSISLQIQQVFDPVTDFFDDLQTFIKEHPTFLENLEHWPQCHRDQWIEIAKYGWFLNWHTPLTINKALLMGQGILDDFMTYHLTNDWEEISSKIIQLYPERQHILSEAFELHQAGRYIASIPLLLSQTDGICAQNLGAYLFSEHPKRQEKSQELTDTDSSEFFHELIHILNYPTQFSAGISSSSPNKKKIAPNRNGILHGSRKHLDYGNKKNSLKCFSLLAFIAFCFDKEK